MGEILHFGEKGCGKVERIRTERRISLADLKSEAHMVECILADARKKQRGLDEIQSMRRWLGEY